MAKRDFIFIDEAGEPGHKIEPKIKMKRAGARYEPSPFRWI
jgi:hypothetical protein